MASRENSPHINNGSLFHLRPENTYLQPDMYVFMAHANLVGSEEDVDNAKGAQKEHNYECLISQSSFYGVVFTFRDKRFHYKGLNVIGKDREHFS